MMISDEILLAESKDNDSLFTGIEKNQFSLQRQVYSPPSMVSLESYSINSGADYVQPENSNGVWGTHS